MEDLWVALAAELVRLALVSLRVCVLVLALLEDLNVLLVEEEPAAHFHFELLHDVVQQRAELLLVAHGCFVHARVHVAGEVEAPCAGETREGEGT